MELERRQKAVLEIAVRLKAALQVAPDVFEGIEMSDYQIAWLAAAAYEALRDAERCIN